MKIKALYLKKTVAGVLLLLSFTQSFSQKIIKDSRGKDILEYYKGGAIQGDFSPTQTSLSVSYSQVLGSPVYYYVNQDTTQKTVGKSHAISFTGKIEGSGTDAGKPFNISKGLIRPSYRLEVGYQRTIDKFYNISKIPDSKPFAFNAGVNIFGEYQDINLYDTLSKIQSNLHPFVYGIHTHVTFFNSKGFKKGLLKNFACAFSLSGDISSTYNSENFTSYQERTASGYMDANIIALGEETGNIGTYERDGAYRLRASLPIFLNQYINLAPYASMYGFHGGSNNWLPGFSINFFIGSPRAEKSSLEQGFGFAVDWPKTKGERKPTFAIYGSLAFDKLKKVIKGIAD